MFIELIILLVTSLLIYFYYAHKRVHSFYEKRGVKYVPGIPFFGNAWQSTLSRRHMIYDLEDVYKAFPNERYVGYIESTLPLIMIRDPELIKTITIKDFDNFTDHRSFFDPEFDPLFGGSILMMKGDKWRDMRATLSPAFTGSKMKLMMPFMQAIGNNIVEYLADHVNKEIEFGDVMSRYTNDVIASAAFGLQINSLKDKNNQFYSIGQNMFSFTATQKLKFIIATVFPFIRKIMDMHFFPKETTDFFQKLVSDTIEYRKKNNVERPDMIQLLIEASKGTLKANPDEHDDLNDNVPKSGKIKEWTQTELIGQVFIFFAAGFETSSGTLSTTVHELALNPDVQEKLYQEIKEFKERKGTIAYDNINELKYLNCVINETLRKWSPAIFMDRVCNKPYTLPPPHEGGKEYQLNAGDIIYNVVNALHMDPRYFPNPDKFDPERFSDENKDKIHPATFLPFGMGPRICIGLRFAMLELKVLLYHLVLNYKIVRSKKTSDPIVITADIFVIKARGGTWAKLEERK